MPRHRRGGTGQNGAGSGPRRRARKPTTQQRACRSIDKLPAEVLLQILSDPCISKIDLKSIRCARRVFNNVSTELLFRRIRISEIWHDYDSFLAIASRPHLAVNVHTVAWTEISGRPAELHPISDLGEEEGNLFCYLRDHVMKKIFWWPLVEIPNLYYPQHAQIAAQRRVHDQFLPAFLSALERLPNLRCLALEPMHPCRELKATTGQKYGLTPQLFQTQFVTNEAPSCATHINMALYRFLLPAMQHLAEDRKPYNAARPVITQLTLRDPGHPDIDFLHSTAMESLSSPFRHLTRLDVDLDARSLCRFRNDPEMLRCLAGAEELTHLSLEFKEDSIPGTTRPEREQNLRYKFLQDWPTFPRLEYLRVDAYQNPGGSLVAFVAKHTKTLVRLQLNNLVDNDELWADLRTAAPGLEISTHVDGDGRKSWATEAYRWRGDSRVPNYTCGPSVGRTHDNGVPLLCPYLIIDKDPLEEAQRSHAPVGSLDFDPIDPAGPGDVVGLYEPDDGDFDTAASIRAEMKKGRPTRDRSPDKRGAYASEETSFLRNRGLLYDSDGVRLNPAPRWYFVRDFNGQMLFRRAHPEHEIGGFPTENWLFTHRSGRRACGDDPLEYFDDWEGSEAGDVQEPTPFGAQITKARREWSLGAGMVEEMKRGTRLAELGVAWAQFQMKAFREGDYPVDPAMHVAPAEESEDSEYDGDWDEDEDSNYEDEDEDDEEESEEEDEDEDEYEDSEAEDWAYYVWGQ